MRTFTTSVLDMIEQRMKTIAEATCAAFECGCDFEFERNYPPTINHEAETAFARQVLADVAGSGNVLEFEPTMGAEDFSYFLQEKPGCYFMIAKPAMAWGLACCTTPATTATTSSSRWVPPRGCGWPRHG